MCVHSALESGPFGLIVLEGMRLYILFWVAANKSAPRAARCAVRAADGREDASDRRLRKATPQSDLRGENLISSHL